MTSGEFAGIDHNYAAEETLIPSEKRRGVRLKRMPIPAFNDIKAPALAFFADGKPHSVKEVFESLAPIFRLTDSELNELLPSGRQRRWHNRANWACYDMYRAGLLMQLKRVFIKSPIKAKPSRLKSQL